LANGLGNLVSRVTALAEKYCDGKAPEISRVADEHPLRVDEKIHNWKKAWADIDKFIPEFRFDEALKSVWKFITAANEYINAQEPWKLAETNKEEFNWVIYGLLDAIHQIAWQIYPFLPDISLKIAKALKIDSLLKENPKNKDSWTNIKPGTKIDLTKPLFPRL
jgi:methionyl-tRNA synthetase